MRCRVLILTMCAFLGACGRSGDLPPQEVLKRTARASQELQSARFFLGATPRWESGSMGGELTFNVDGRLQNGGDQLQFLTSVQGDIRGLDGIKLSLTSAFEVMVSGPEEIYLNVHALTSQPLYPPLASDKLAAIIGQWWRLSTPVSPLSSSSMATDPRLLRIQSEVVDIVRDRGQTILSGRSMYHYNVRLNTEKLLTFLREVSRARAEVLDTKILETILPFVNADGELFIDAETFLIHRLLWNIDAPDLPFGTFSLDLTLDLKDHGNAPPILPPVNALPFPLSPSLPFDVDHLSTGNLLQEIPSSLEEDLINTVTDDAL